MDLNDIFSRQAAIVMSSARENLVCLKDRFFASEHVLLAILDREENRVKEVLVALGVDPSVVRDALMDHMHSFSSDVRQKRPSFGYPRQLLERAAEEVFGADTPTALALAADGELGVRPQPPQIDLEHFLLGILRDSQSTASLVLSEFGVTYESFKEQLSLA